MVLGGWECSGDGNAAVTFELHARCGVPCGRMEMCLAARKMRSMLGADTMVSTCT